MGFTLWVPKNTFYFHRLLLQAENGDHDEEIFLGNKNGILKIEYCKDYHKGWDLICGYLKNHFIFRDY